MSREVKKGRAFNFFPEEPALAPLFTTAIGWSLARRLSATPIAAMCGRVCHSNIIWNLLPLLVHSQRRGAAILIPREYLD